MRTKNSKKLIETKLRLFKFTYYENNNCSKYFSSRVVIDHSIIGTKIRIITVIHHYSSMRRDGRAKVLECYF